MLNSETRRPYAAYIAALITAAFIVARIVLIATSQNVPSNVIKILTSVSFMATAIFSTVHIHKACSDKQKKYTIIMLLGLFAAFCGDVLIMFNFIAGVLSFLAAHIFFLSAFMLFRKITLRKVIATIVIFLAISLTLQFLPGFDYDIGMPELLLKGALMIYAFALCGMTVKSTDAFYLAGKNRGACLLFAGALLFLVSDFDLMFNIFGKYGETAEKLTSIINNVTYYGGQILISLSLAYDLFAEKEKQA